MRFGLKTSYDRDIRLFPDARRALRYAALLALAAALPLLLDDFLLSQAMLFGFSLRCSNNRFKEGILNALFSAATFGLFNATTGNQSTHCLLVRPSPPYPLTARDNNRALVDAFFQSFCAQVDEALGGFGNPQPGGGQTDPGDIREPGKEGG